VNVESAPAVVQLTVRLVAARERVDDLVATLQQAVMWPAQQMRGCRFAQVYRSAGDRRRVEYVEEWDELRELRQECRSERFTRLIEVIEMAAEAPDVEVRDITGVHGLDYIAAARTSSDARDAAAGGSEIGGRGDPECRVDGEHDCVS
jgi:quinol monooxygenase YgiN